MRPDRAVYRATDAAPTVMVGACRSGDEDAPPWKWRPSLLMPQWACRLWCEVTGEPRALRPRDVMMTDELIRMEGFPLPDDDPEGPCGYEEFMRRIHGDALDLDGWMWIYPGLQATIWRPQCEDQ
jgi:hypothetical protein